jgi:integrase/recombinase XerD
MITLTNWHTCMLEDMKLRDFRPRTQEGYLLATRQFLERVNREPETLIEDDLRRYFLYLKEEKKLAPSSINIGVHAIRFFFLHPLQKDWKVLALLRVNKPRVLPIVLSRPEVRKVLEAIRQPVRRTALTTIYALGLRINEALHLRVEDIDGERLVVWVRDGKGARDRGVPLPRPLLTRLRRYWKLERPLVESKYLFVSKINGDSPLHETTIQKTFTAACREIGLEKRATVHTLRHSYATHLLEAGISLRAIQQVLGHKSLRTTEVYLHVTHPGAERLQQVVDELMSGL